MSSSFYEKHIVHGERQGDTPLPSSLQDLLQNAIAGDPDAAVQVLGYLTAGLHDLRHIMRAAIHANSDPRLWRCLLTYLAVGEWGEWDPFGDSQTSRRRRLSWQEPQRGAAAQAITELFCIDADEAEGERKLLVLRRALHGPGLVRNAAACMLGLRGVAEAIPLLEDMICGGGNPAQAAHPAWQIRAVEALAALGDSRCGPALLCALTSGDGQLHQAAARALRELGPAAEDVLLLALLHPDSHIRWHAARSLGQIGMLHGLDILAEGLRDEHPAVRWATADVLANLDTPAIPYILRMMIDHPMDERFRAAIIHSLHAMSSHAAQSYLKPLLVALRDPTAAYEAPVIAQKMLAEWKTPIPAATLPDL